MKSFSSAYENSREEVKSQRAAIINQEHAEIVNAMKKTFGINNFSALNESERESYREMLHKMWNKEEGLTPAGVSFINESKTPITKKSTPEQVKSILKSKFKAAMNTIWSQASAGSAKSGINEIYEEVKAVAAKEGAGALVTKAIAFEALSEALKPEIKKRFSF